MAYLKAKRKEGKTYYQLIEAYREGGQKHERVLLHLGADLSSPHTLLRWWDYLGRPRIPYKPGMIVDLERFLHLATEEERTLAAEGLKFLLS